MKQARVITKLGGFQVQLSMSTSHYLVYVNLCFVAMMFWHTTATPFLQQYDINASFWVFAIFMLLIMSAVMVFDYKFIYPSRQAFISQQAYRHANPAVADLQKLLKNDEILLANDKKIMEKLGIEE